jgi:hypothetical protein
MLALIALVLCCCTASGSPVPIRSITGPDSRPCPAVFDGDADTGVTVRRGSYIIRRDSDKPLTSIAFEVSAAEEGALTVRCEDLMSLRLAYHAGHERCRLRLPWSTARVIRVVWDEPGATWEEAELLGRTPVPSRWAPDEVWRDAVTVALGDSTAPSCDVPVGAMCSWFELGITDGITKPGTREELIARVREFPLRALRFPGGTSTYGYPPCREAIPAYVNAQMGNYAYGLWWMDRYGYASPEDYFRFCRDAGIIAWYEINPGFWYDRARDAVVKTVAMDNTGDTYAGDTTAQAVAQAVELAKSAKQIGGEIVWEIGNEDYSYYTPATYAKLCAAFMNGIRAVDPEARFAVCGDGESWSDLSFSEAFVKALRAQGITRLDYSSQHLYMVGVWQPDGAGGWKPMEWGTPLGVCGSMARGWPLIRDLFLRGPKRFHEAGIQPAKLAVTEFNVAAGGITDKPELEHCVGRALGEAEALCGLQQDGANPFFHDLVRSGPDECWFARLDYYPKNPAGRRYFWFPEAAAASVVALHGAGRIVHNADGVCVSRHPGFAYITVVNRSSRWRVVSVTLQGVTLDVAKSIEQRTFRAAAPECAFYDYWTDTARLDPPRGSRLRIEAGPWSVVGVKVYLR